MAAPQPFPYGEPRKPYGLAKVDGAWRHVGSGMIEHPETKQRMRLTCFGWVSVAKPGRPKVDAP